MASFNKVPSFTKNVLDAAINFASGQHVFKVMLTNSVPGSFAVKGDLTEIAVQFGYPSGGLSSTTSTTTTGGVGKVIGADVTFTASGGAIGPFQYAWLYDDTQTSPNKPLVGYWNYGSPVTLQDGETFTVDFDAANGVLTIT